MKTIFLGKFEVISQKTEFAKQTKNYSSGNSFPKTEIRDNYENN